MLNLFSLNRQLMSFSPWNNTVSSHSFYRRQPITTSPTSWKNTNLTASAFCIHSTSHTVGGIKSNNDCTQASVRASKKTLLKQSTTLGICCNYPISSMTWSSSNSVSALAWSLLKSLTFSRDRLARLEFPNFFRTVFKFSLNQNQSQARTAFRHWVRMCSAQNFGTVWIRLHCRQTRRQKWIKTLPHGVYWRKN